jgi:transglutaminase-like putative cysteine protease
MRRVQSLPIEAPEESVLLRLLAQAMVTIGIVALDVAAESDDKLSYWAIPLSIAGAVLSYYRRYKRNIAIKFCLAILMLLALVAFFSGLRTASNDTRLVLAELLVRLQVLHAFDLPRRKDLGYSMIIGLILLGVACTLSQTMVFGLFLLLFLAIALPVLVLDYRSRLGLLGHSFKSPFRQIGLSPKQLGTFLAVTLALGLTLFAFMPRLPGYQLRTFPVSPQIDTPETFDNSQIVNPGYVRNGSSSGSSGGAAAGISEQGFGPGKLDSEFYYGFNTRINQNLRGAMKPKVVMRVRSQAEGYWRVLAFDRYLGQGWEISRTKESQTLKRPAWSYQFFLPRPFVATRNKEIVQTYTITADLPNIIPALQQPKELYFPTVQVGIDPEGNLRSPLGLREGLTYTVISEVPYRDRTRLGQTATNYPKPISKAYLEVPAKIRSKVRQQAEALLAKSEKPLTNPYEKVLFLTQALKQNYSIQSDMAFLKADEDLVDAFLFKFKGGYPDHFSTVLAIMLRSLGIPARLAAGFSPGEFNAFTGLYVVRNTDAYAVTEVYFPRYGWFAFDPIPGHELIPPSIEEDQTFGVLRQFWNWVAGWLPSPVSSILGRIFGTLFSWIVGAVGWFINLFSQGWLGIFTAILTATSFSFLGWLARLGWQRWQHQRWLAKLPPMERAYQQMLNCLATQGIQKRSAQTPFEFVEQVMQQQSQERTIADSGYEAIAYISNAYVRWRYSGEAENLAQVQQHLNELTRPRRAWQR